MMSGSTVRRHLWHLLALFTFTILPGCTNNTTEAGKDGIPIQVGAWVGQSDNGSYSVEFNITSFSNVGTTMAVFSYGYPCGDRFTFVSPPKAIKIDLSNSAFDTKIEQTNFSGKFIDSTHVEGTWEVFKHQIPFLDRICPAAKGTWKGSPK